MCTWLKIDEVITQHELVRKYAQLKLIAIDYRKDGKIDDALKIERKMDNLYDILPEKTKW